MLVASTYRQSEKDVEKGFKAQKYECDILKDLDAIFLVPIPTMMYKGVAATCNCVPIQ